MGIVINQCSKSEVHKYFEKSNIDISKYTQFFKGSQKKDFVIATDTSRTSGIYLNEPDILTEEQENEIYVMTGIHVNTLDPSDVLGYNKKRRQSDITKTMLAVAGVIVIVILIKAGVALSGN